MVNAKDITNQRFGKLVAVSICGKSKRENVWLCLCECGGVAEVRISNLTSGNTRSCGCLQVDSAL